MPPVTPDGRVHVPVYYDFASSLCHVAHRVLGRMVPLLDELAVRLTWIPIDLAALLHWRRGHLVSGLRRDHVRAIADGLGVAISIPTHWLDSRPFHAVALHRLALDRAHGAEMEPALRERVFTRLFDEAAPRAGEAPARAAAHERARETALEIAAECGLACRAEDLERGQDALEAWTRHASDQMVSGVPTFMLGPWPFGGIQEDATMESILRRWATKVRAERVSSAAVN